jgi:hypothetical protein
MSSTSNLMELSQSKMNVYARNTKLTIYSLASQWKFEYLAFADLLF